MSDIPKPNVANDLIRIHKIVTRGLDVAIEHGRAYAQDGYPDDSTKAGFVSYVQALASVTHGHHVTEDDLAFPYFETKLPALPVEDLTREHREMQGILDEIQTAIDGVADEAEPGQALDALNRALNKLAGLWQPHIRKEEDDLKPEVLGKLIGVDEQIGLAQQFAQHSQKHTGPDFLVVPFMLYNLSPGDRAILSQAMPPIVTQQLVPMAWKEQWAPMKPFLLD
jgi:hemerythrin-like domain-containing protein